MIRKEVKSINEEETKSKDQDGKIRCGVCKRNVFGKMGAGQSCDDYVDVVRLSQKENGPIIRPVIVEFRSEYDKRTVMRMKAKLREVEEYRFFFRNGSVKGKERVKEGKNTQAERRDNAEREAADVNSMVAEKRSLTVVWNNVRKIRSRERGSLK